jgi:hypothetical protein
MGSNLILCNFSLKDALHFFNVKGWTRRQEDKGRKFFVEGYVHNVVVNDYGVTASCFRSQKKNAKPHRLHLIFEILEGWPKLSSTDITTDKYLGCTVIYFSLKRTKIINYFLDLVELENANADAIADALLAYSQYYENII